MRLWSNSWMTDFLRRKAVHFFFFLRQQASSFVLLLAAASQQHLQRASKLHHVFRHRIISIFWSIPSKTFDESQSYSSRLKAWPQRFCLFNALVLLSGVLLWQHWTKKALRGVWATQNIVAFFRIFYSERNTQCRFSHTGGGVFSPCMTTGPEEKLIQNDMQYWVFIVLFQQYVVLYLT